MILFLPEIQPLSSFSFFQEKKDQKHRKRVLSFFWVAYELIADTIHLQKIIAKYK